MLLQDGHSAEQVPLVAGRGGTDGCGQRQGVRKEKPGLLGRKAGLQFLNIGSGPLKGRDPQGTLLLWRK